MPKEDDTPSRQDSETSDNGANENSSGFLFGETRDADSQKQGPTEARTIDSSGIILTVGPSEVRSECEVCSKVLVAGTTTLENLLLITWTQSPTVRKTVCGGYLEEVPENVVIINVGGASGVTWSEQIPSGPDQSVNIETINNSRDLARIGIRISQTLSGWGDTADRTAACFHSVTAMLQFIDDRKRVFHFLKILANRLTLAGVSANFHLQPDGISDDTFQMLRPIFDAIIAYDDSGNTRLLKNN